MAEIFVCEAKGGKAHSYEVMIKEGASSTTHVVNVPEDFYQRLTGGRISKTQCLEASFRFLLEREPKESILRSFDLPLIGHYFPDFEQKFKNYL